MSASDFLKKCALLDLEARGDRIFHIGAIYGQSIYERKGSFSPHRALEELDTFASSAHYVLGHNVIGHDIALIKNLYPALKFLNKPIIDTLYLSPLAFPENPYHRLVKNYKLIKSSLNNPLADAELAGSVFVDEWQSFVSLLLSDNHELPSLYRFCFDTSYGEKQFFKGITHMFDALGARSVDKSEFKLLFENTVKDRVCTSVLSEVLTQSIDDTLARPALAYCLAWLKVAGSNSVIPPWIRLRFPVVVTILHRLRDVPCTKPSCEYCSLTHSPHVQLKRYFGFSSFRFTPQGDDGIGIQEGITVHGMSDHPLLAIMPTGGGKSLCYQLPALVRHYRRGLLTVVISPLQALMKDQVDNVVQKTGSPSAAAIYGMLTPPERGEVLERVRLGDIALLYVAPEQFRNATFKSALLHREIGSWVFDEAHCISKWGHDFRPDYLYAARFIREFAEEQKTPIPPIACFTATAKSDVKQEIIRHFKEELGQDLIVFEGSIERENLNFEVQMVKPAHKFDRIHSIISERLYDVKGAAVVYGATRQAVEDITFYLKKQGWQAETFHAGLITPRKRAVQEAFIAGHIQVICATNAFGMGIDKEDIRLVLHADMPGSLENYLQEAGRAGRDLKDAECILLYSEADVEKQFRLNALSKLSRRDIAQILRGLRRWSKNRTDEIVITARELLRDEEIDPAFDSEDPMADTKVKTAVAWLERAGFVERNQNNTRIFQGQVLVKDTYEAEKKIADLNLSKTRKTQWLDIIRKLINSENSDGIGADELAEMPSFKEEESQRRGEKKFSFTERDSATYQVLRALHDMAESGLIKKGLVLNAYVRHKTAGSSRSILKRVCILEKALLDLMQELMPDVSPEGWLSLSLRSLNQKLINDGHESNPDTLRSLLTSLSLDGRGLAGKEGSIEIRHIDREHYRVKLQRPWKSLVSLAQKRQSIADVTLHAILSLIPPETPASSQLLVTFTSNDIVEALRADLFLAGQITDMLAAVDRALMFLHEQKVIILQHGLSVFRQAMTIRILEHSKGRPFTQGDYEPLSQYYGEKIFQVHVMNEYARLGVDKIRKALRLVAAYFTLSKSEFVKQYFEGRSEIIERATGQESYIKIVENLNNSVQIQAVTAHVNKNMLILAGPGSGKTRTVVHRCAYLLRVKRVKAQSIIMLCFNRNAAVTMRHRLYDLVGNDAKGVTIQTYHSMAMRLTGTSFYNLSESLHSESVKFDEVIEHAIMLLKGEKPIPGIEHDEIRDRILSGYSHILVDEYQDIDENQYALISALAGRKEKDHDQKLAIMAVGDDDQNIYTFRGANIRFIQKFQEDYKADIFYLVENYRSTAHIIKAANQLISRNQDRMKTEKPIVINKARSNNPEGGLLSTYDSAVSKGRVQVLSVDNASHQASAVLSELKRLSQLIPDFTWTDCAVLTRTHSTLQSIRACLEYHHIPVTWCFPKDKTPPLFRVREIAGFIHHLKPLRQELMKSSEIEKLLDNLSASYKDNPWYGLLKSLVLTWKQETAEAQLPAHLFIEYLYETLTEQKRSFHFGKGVFLSTIHGAKGLEFPHVLIPDDKWIKSRKRVEGVEEERRLFYVAMTRAQHSLCLFQRADLNNPHIPLLQKDLLVRSQGAREEQLSESVIQKRYEILSMKDLFLDYAGWRAPTNSIHRHLSALKVGSPLFAHINDKDKKLRLHNDKNNCLALISQGAAKNWLNRLKEIQTIRVIAMIQREKKDVNDKTFKDKCCCEKWEVPIVEVVCRG